MIKKFKCYNSSTGFGAWFTLSSEFGTPSAIAFPGGKGKPSMYDTKSKEKDGKT